MPASSSIVRFESLVPGDELAPGRPSRTTSPPAPAGGAPAPADGGATTPTTTTVTPAPDAKPLLPALREVTTAAIGIAIVFVTLVMAWRLFSMSTTPPAWTRNPPQGVAPALFDPFQRGKDVLLILLPLAGAIVGYYTGRVISERTIDQANQAAQNATNTAAQAQTTATAAQDEAAKAQQAKQDVKADAEVIAEVAFRKSASAGLERRGGLEAAGGSADPDLEEVTRRLARIRSR